MDNSDLSIEFVKKYQECRRKGVSEGCAVLATLQDLADYKDRQLKGIFVEWLKSTFDVNEYEYNCVKESEILTYRKSFDDLIDEIERVLDGREVSEPVTDEVPKTDGGFHPDGIVKDTECPFVLS